MGIISCIFIVLIAIGVIIYIYTADNRRNKSCTVETEGKIIGVDKSRQHLVTVEYEYKGLHKKELSVSDSQKIIKELQPRIHMDGTNGLQSSIAYRAIYEVEEEDVVGTEVKVFVNPQKPNIIHAELKKEK